MIVSVSPDQAEAFEKFVKDIPLQKLGSVTDGNTSVDAEDFGDIQDWHKIYHGALEAELNS